MKCEIIKVELYRHDLMFFIGSLSELRNSLNKYLMNKTEIREIERHLKAREFWDGNNKGFCYQFKGGQTLIILPREPETIEELATLNHEILHVVFFILKKIGIRYTPESEESYTYLYAFLTEKIYRLLPISFSYQFL